MDAELNYTDTCEHAPNSQPGGNPPNISVSGVCVLF
jgi:hypothetical protein